MRPLQGLAIAGLLIIVLPWTPLILILCYLAFKAIPQRTKVRAGRNVAHLVPPSAKRFTPHPLFCFPYLSGHVQTVAVLWKSFAPWYDERTALECPDKSRLGLWWRLGTFSKAHPIVVLFPGLTGDAQAPYAGTMANHLKSSFRVVLAVPRGCGDSTLGGTPYNARQSRDHYLVLLHVAKRFPDAPLLAIGFSLGANLLVNALYDYAEELSPLVRGAMCVGSPWDLERSSKHLEEGRINQWLFSKALADGLVEYFKRNKRDIEAQLGAEAAKHVRPKRLTSVRKFDERVTAPVGGYKSVNEYYQDASTHRRVKSVRVPLLCVSAADDPIVAAAGMPLDELTSPNAIFVLANTGGHLGFGEYSRDWLTVSWIDRVAKDFFGGLVQSK